jgi:hypothetical protein
MSEGISDLSGVPAAQADVAIFSGLKSLKMRAKRQPRFAFAGLKNAARINSDFP